ncbi:MAG: GlxA family transcriptional regulator [Rhodobacteraceae bacterium]|nr:GlxA family transcriptional regulator [Paracoccaceae bacterium]
METRSFVPKGAASFRVDHKGPPRDFYFLLLPRLTMLAFSSAVEPLRVANQVTNKELYRWFVMTEDGKPVQCSNGIAIVPDSGLQNLPRNALAFVCAGTEPAGTTNPKITAWISRQRAFGCRLGGICTGAFALARAGLLDGQTFTLHWENQPAFREHFPGLEPTGNLYENDDGLITCGGGSAATDMMLDIIQKDHGKDLAAIVADMCIHLRSNDRTSPQKSAYSVALSSRNQRLITAIQLMGENLETPLAMDDIAGRLKISRRQVERLFMQYVEMTPVQFYLQLRISRAYSLLSETNLSVAEIAAATGFGDASHLTARFKKRYGRSPRAFRRSWGESEG